MVDTQSQSSDGNSFVTGFTVGLFVGAAGYYLFATEKGAKLRKQVSAEWENAKVELAEEGVIENPKLTLREFIQDVLKKTFPETSKVAKNYQREIVEDIEIVRKKAKESAAKARKDGKKFKGV